jgi:uncharacterized membrane protein
MISTVGLLSWSIILHYYIRKNFFKKRFSYSLWKIANGTSHSSNPWDYTTIWSEGVFNLALFSPKEYFRKGDLQKGYSLYILHIFFFILSLIFFYFYLTHP